MSTCWQEKQVCVVGGSGFLGFHLVKQLLCQGARVRVLSLAPRSGHPLWHMPDVDKRFGDLLDVDHVRAALRDCAVVFHAAGIVAVWGPALARMFDVHVTGTRNVLDAAPAGARVVHTSSIVTVGASRWREVVDEDESFNLSRLKVDYVHAKRAAEDVALQAAGRGQHVVVVNPAYLLGPEDHECSVMGRLCTRFWRGRVLLTPPGGFNLVDVRDVAAGHLLAAEHGRPGRRYILGGENRTLPEFLDALARTAGWRPRTLPRLPAWALRAFAGLAHLRACWTRRQPYPSLQAARMQGYTWFCSSDRARRELGYHARPLEQTLADTYAWYTARGLKAPHGFLRWWLRPATPTVCNVGQAFQPDGHSG
jgi:dihydroflavonol-4-reductase